MSAPLFHLKTPLLRLTALSLVFAAAGCSEQLGPEATDDRLQGMIEQAPLVEGAPIVHKVTIEGSALKPKTHYVLKKGILIINGQVPNGASVKVRSGRIVVRGDVGAGVRLAARMPEKTQRESYTCMRYDVNLKVNLPMTCHRTVRLGLAYPSETPGIDITGYVDDKAKVSSNAGVRATCVSPTARFGTDWEKPISVKAVGPIESCPRRF